MVAVGSDIGVGSCHRPVRRAPGHESRRHPTAGLRRRCGWQTRGSWRGGDSGAGTGRGQGWQWDVVLSFAGAQRGYVEQVAGALKARGVRCFYDDDEQIDLWGKYLAEELPAIYSERAAAAVVFISAEYAARDWTRLERRAALSRAVRERQEYVLPAGSTTPRCWTDIATVDLRPRTPQEFAAMIAAKLATLGITSPGPGRRRELDSGRWAGTRPTVRSGQMRPTCGG